MSAPNLRIIMRDDWIEMSCVSIYAGHMIKFVFHANGAVLRNSDSSLSEDDDEPIQPISAYEALSLIADMVTDNIQALDDRNAASRSE